MRYNEQPEEKLTVPPRGRVAIEAGYEKVHHGVDVYIKLRCLDDITMIELLQGTQSAALALALEGGAANTGEATQGVLAALEMALRQKAERDGDVQEGWSPND